MFQDTNDWRSMVAGLQSLNTRRLKHVGIVTYFGVYALIALGIRRGLNSMFQSLPQTVRPAPLLPLDVLFGLPTSVAWSLTSLGVALFTVGVVACHSLFVSLSRGDEATDTDASVDPNDETADATSTTDANDETD
ncbi:hypothetical protein SAMN04487948_12265 [Halogranum amylolyticum]|uniref:Uncharacterized protein n=1 Tax=Halogranum amylolyticum TaxID=660520 RepID=A0A1H8W2W5_9EURY|nr:hypothetical protein [Halogranum amylolyticum]SEP21989.1 hypothetical protein SAMN04487948_12265 [Halogranum amylolyticum]